MSRVRIQFMPFDSLGNYTGEWTDVTEDIVSIGSIKQGLDTSDYDIGMFRNSEVQIVLNNESGEYSDFLEPFSMFDYKRSGTKVRILWEPGNRDLLCYFFKCEDPWAIISDDEIIFNGILDDTATKESIVEQNIGFKCLGLESIFSSVECPYDLFVGNDFFSDIVKDCLNQSEITKTLFYDPSRVSVSLDIRIDSQTPFMHKTVQEVLREVLVTANSALYVDRFSRLHVSPRTPAVDVSHTFYGPGSLLGTCDIIGIDYLLGNNRLLNHVYWSGTAVVSVDADSTDLYGIQQKELNYDFITDSGKQNQITDSIVGEFGARKAEIKLTTTLTPETAVLGMLDRVNIDYPGLTLDPIGFPVAVYGIGKYGVDHYAVEINNMRILTTINWKILGRTVHVDKDLIEFHLREI